MVRNLYQPSVPTGGQETWVYDRERAGKEIIKSDRKREKKYKTKSTNYLIIQIYFSELFSFEKIPEMNLNGKTEIIK